LNAPVDAGVAGWTLVEAARAVATRTVSSRELVSACLARIERWQPRINAFVAVFAERALAAADRADAQVAHGGALGPLHGVPLAHKDMFFRPGRVSTMGSRAAPPAAATICTLLQRLDEAGAIELGTLNMAEFALGPTGHNEFLGHCRNPWNPAHVACGSSSGSGASVAARLAFGSLGSDTGGSVRLPASVNGVLGLKPTHGLLSGHGMMPLSHSTDTPGILARTTADLALLLKAVAGHDPRDPRTSRRPVPDYPALLGDGSLRGVRVGVPVSYFGERVSADVAVALDASLRVLADLGAEIVPVPVPAGPTEHYTELSRVLVYAEAAAIHGPRLRHRASDYSPQVRVRAATGLGIPSAVYVQALQLRSVLLEEFVRTVFTQCDVLHLPTLGIAAPTIEETDVGGTAVMWEKIAVMVRCTAPFNYLGLPALAVPCGFTVNGLPTSFQLVGRPFAEGRLLRVASAYERCTDWVRGMPGADA
jgi:aspartyl-tRNA(Asn)/glutamyl-tRNA(Gln) amidotransferase subunit A